MRYTAPSLLALALLTGCGGDSTPTPTPTPVPTPTPTPTPSVPNGPPSFTSPATASVAENTIQVYQATATDPDNNPFAFTISGGADAARFTIDGTGKLSFVAAPDFEQPTDADANNVYLVTLRVSDGTASATLDLQITVTNSSENIAVRRVGTGFSSPSRSTPRPTMMTKSMSSRRVDASIGSMSRPAPRRSSSPSPISRPMASAACSASPPARAPRAAASPPMSW